MVIELANPQIQEALRANTLLFPPDLRRERGVHLLVPGQPIPEGFPMSRLLHIDLHPGCWKLRDMDRQPIRVPWGRRQIEISRPGKSANLLYTRNVAQAVRDIFLKETPRAGDTLYIFDQSHLREAGLIAVFAPLRNRPYHVRIAPLDGIYEDGEIPAPTVRKALELLRSNRIEKITHR